jgi:hypothetical protein
MPPRRELTVAEPARVMITRVGLHIPARLPFPEWEQAGLKLTQILDSSCWCLGDWLVYGREHFTNRYQHTVAVVGLRHQTLRNYAWVAGQFHIGQRRDRLSFQHHAEVASLPHIQRDQWLDRAERDNWTTKQLRWHLRAARTGTGLSPSTGTVTRRLEVGRDHFDRWLAAAHQGGVDIDHWVVATLDNAAERTLAGYDRAAI